MPNQLRTRKKSSERAQALLASAEAILVEDGVAGLSARAVADRAGLAKGLVFYYFDGTDALVAEVLERYYEKNKEVLKEACRVEGSRRDRVHGVIDALFDFMIENRAYARIVQQQAVTDGPHLSIVRAHLRDTLAITSEIIGELASGSGALSAAHVHHSVSALIVQYFTMGVVLGEDYWGADPMSEEALDDRRTHVHWAIDAWLDRLERS